MIMHPALQSPSNGTATSSTSVTLEWTASAGAAGYRLDWDGTVSDVGSHTWQVLTGLADDTYSWSVAAYDDVGNISAYPAAWTVRVDTTPPAPPAPASPANEETIVDPTPTLHWPASADAVGYIVGWDGEEVDVGDVLSRTVSTTDGTHVWTVAAYDHVDNESDDADPRSLRVDTMPPTVDAAVPDDGATGVAPAAPLVITFSEPVDPDSLQMSASPDPGGWFAAWSPGNQAVTLSHAPFEVETTYVVTVLTVDDVAGLAMIESYSWTFETGKYLLYMPLVVRAY